MGADAPEEPGSFGQVDVETLRHAYVNITAGACFAIGLRYAGSANADAFSCLMHYAKMFLNGAPEIGRPTLETSLNLVVLCIGMVFAGTGDLAALRFFRQLNARVSDAVTYGSHMTVNMALGFLFMGGGTLSLGTSNEDIVALVAACFPRFPITSSDNRYHLQALRHLYVLAVSPCVVVARDVDTGEPCYVPMTLNLPKSKTQLKLITPCIIPDLNQVSNLTVQGPRYAAAATACLLTCLPACLALGLALRCAREGLDIYFLRACLFLLLYSGSVSCPRSVPRRSATACARRCVSARPPLSHKP